jgi:hypothetical protein
VTGSRAPAPVLRMNWYFVVGLAVVVGSAAAYGIFLRGTSALAHADLVWEGAVIDSMPSDARRYRVTLEPPRGRPKVGETQPWLASIADAQKRPLSGCQLHFGGIMPEHGHGLPTEPRLTQEPEPGRYLIEAVRFSMRGYWRMSLEIAGCGLPDLASFDLRL